MATSMVHRRHLAGSSSVSYEVVVHNLNKIDFPRYIDWKSSANKERFDILFDLPKMISLNGNERIKALVNESTLGSDTNSASLIVETPTTLRWSNLPGILTTGGLLRLKLNNFAIPSTGTFAYYDYSIHWLYSFYNFQTQYRGVCG